MSGVLGALLVGSNATQYSVGVANLANATAIYGYNPASAAPKGTISATAFKSTTINNVSARGAAAGSPYDFSIVLDGTLAQSFFDSVQVVGDSGTRFFHTSAASLFSTVGGITTWQWAATGSPVWTSAATRIMLLNY